MLQLCGPRFEVLKNGSLYIKELRYGDQARYGCIAGNSGGFSRQETHLLVRGEGSNRRPVYVAVGEEFRMYGMLGCPRFQLFLKS